MEPIQLDYCTISEPGMYVIFHSLVESVYNKPQCSLLSDRVQHMYGELTNYLAHQSSTLIHWSCMEMDDAESLPILHVFSLSSIHSPLVAVPYDLDQFESGLDQEQWLSCR